MKLRLINALLFLLSKLITREKLLERLIEKSYPSKFGMLFLFDDKRTALAMLDLKEQIESGELEIVEEGSELLSADDMGLPEDSEEAPAPKKPLIN